MRYGSKERELFGGEPDTTNNRMELTAVIRGLDAMTRAVTVHVHTDSTYVMQGITKWIHGWKKNGWRTSSKEPVKNADLWQLLEAAVARHTVHWHWVKGHAGHEGNERADRLAGKGVDLVRASASSAT